MRINYYRFPDDADEQVMLDEGCSVILKNGNEFYPDTIPDDKRDLVDHIDHVIGGITVTAAKKLIKKYGGSAWTEHCERDGSLFDVTPIELDGNNSRFKYNHHL